MDQQRIIDLKAMIEKADFLTNETKQVFLAKTPYLNEKKFADLYEIFEHDQEERKVLRKKKMEIFDKCKITMTGIYQKAKSQIIAIKEKALKRDDQSKLSALDNQLNNL